MSQKVSVLLGLLTIASAAVADEPTSSQAAHSAAKRVALAAVEAIWLHPDPAKVSSLFDAKAERQDDVW